MTERTSHFTRRDWLHRSSMAVATMALAQRIGAEDPAQAKELPTLVKPGLFKSLTEPPCSYCSTQHRKGLIRDDDLVVAWIRGAHNGGAIPVRHFLAGPRVINDTYGLFFYDPGAGCAAAYKKDYGYEFHGWRGGIMLVKGRDGTIWSCLSGLAVDGPRKGERLERIPSLTTNWGLWRMLHPESTAYDLFDGKKYAVTELPGEPHPDSVRTIGKVDERLPKDQLVHGVEMGQARRAYPLDAKVERACFVDQVGGVKLAVFWYGPTQSSVAFRAELPGRPMTFYADSVSPETAPFMDRETGTRWSLAGRGIDGKLRGQELTWVPGIQAKWYAWSNENPETRMKTGP